MYTIEYTPKDYYKLAALKSGLVAVRGVMSPATLKKNRPANNDYHVTVDYDASRCTPALLRQAFWPADSSRGRLSTQHCDSWDAISGSYRFFKNDCNQEKEYAPLLHEVKAIVSLAQILTADTPVSQGENPDGVTIEGDTYGNVKAVYRIPYAADKAEAALRAAEVLKAREEAELGAAEADLKTSEAQAAAAKAKAETDELVAAMTASKGMKWGVIAVVAVLAVAAVILLVKRLRK